MKLIQSLGTADFDVITAVVKPLEKNKGRISKGLRKKTII